MSGQRFSRWAKTVRPAFSLVELVLVVVILGILAAIAAPRVSRAAGDAERNTLDSTLTTVRKAIDVYYAEHGRYPGYLVSDGSPDGTAFVKQMTLFTDEPGNTNGTYGAPFTYGPYLREPFPVNPFNELDTVAVIRADASAKPAANSTGWIAVLSSGAFKLNGTDADLIDRGVSDPKKRSDLLLP
ncbi:MAG: prepilin-type N-terminal cleavage/methylation domain-containing protein [Phycisphaerales bacterium]|nr:prepilin-type N-terminal cleavage/methylation domain-containing protein [Phycisphaerales bacterium]